MIDDDRFSQEQLEAIEARLWQVANRMSFVDIDLPPVSSMLGATPDCDLYSDSLVQYAIAVMRNQVAIWQHHPLLDHLALCSQCRDTLTQMQASRRPTPKPHLRGWRMQPDIDLTLFDNELPISDPTLRSALDPRRPTLLFSGFLDQPPGWHFTLETEPHLDGATPDLLLTLTAVANSVADISITLVTYGQVLHAVTDRDGQARFPHLFIPAAELLETPVISLHLQPTQQQPV